MSLVELLGNEGEVAGVGCSVSVDITGIGAKVLRDKEEVKDIDSTVTIKVVRAGEFEVYFAVEVGEQMG